MQSNAKKILIIDDDNFLIKLMEMSLKSEGYEVVTANHGKKAIEILSDNPQVDMIVVDLMMPELDGLSFLHWLRKEAKLTIPTLVQTGMANEKIKQQAKDAGSTALINKPVKVPVLLEKIKELENSL